MATRVTRRLPDPEKQAQEVAERLTVNLGRSENLEFQDHMRQATHFWQTLSSPWKS
jgi:hypothetical protein